MRTAHTLAISLLTALSLTLTACAEKSTIALVNPLRLIQNSASGQAGVEHLKRIEASLQEQLTAAQKLIETRPGDENLRIQVQKAFSSYQQLMNAEQKKVADSINNQLKITLEVIRLRHKLTVILSIDNALAFDETKDITGEVLDEMNKEPLSFDAVAIVPIETAVRQNPPKEAKPEPQKAAAPAKPKQK